MDGMDGMEMVYGEKESLSSWGHKWVFSLKSVGGPEGCG